MNLTATLIALFGPFIVWPFELFIPHPYIVEELFKFVLVKTIIKNTTDFSDGLKGNQNSRGKKRRLKFEFSV